MNGSTFSRLSRAAFLAATLAVSACKTAAVGGNQPAPAGSTCEWRHTAFRLVSDSVKQPVDSQRVCIRPGN